MDVWRMGGGMFHCGGRGNSTETGGEWRPRGGYTAALRPTQWGEGGGGGVIKGERGGGGERQRSRLIEDLQAAKSSAMMQNWTVIFC